MKPKMLYIMCVSWHWIYQRPHILAEQLSHGYEVTVVYPFVLSETGKKAADTEQIRFRRLFHTPFRERNRLGEWLFVTGNRLLTLRDVRKFDYLFLDHPVYARFIPEDYQGKVIYDCMDNHEAMCGYASYARNVRRLESFLAKRCDLLLATSETLKTKMDRLVGGPKCVLSRNGTDAAVYPLKIPEIREHYTIGYIGTVSAWFDFALLTSTGRELSSVTYRLIGPADRIVKSDNLIYEGSVPHDALYDRIRDCDCLIMPFQLNEITLAVDPVKLYEYIAFGKCVISIYYPEIERFRDFVYFYQSAEEFVGLVRSLSREGFPVKYSETQREAFLSRNTWEHRARELMINIDEIQV